MDESGIIGIRPTFGYCLTWGQAWALLAGDALVWRRCPTPKIWEKRKKKNTPQMRKKQKDKKERMVHFCPHLIFQSEKMTWAFWNFGIPPAPMWNTPQHALSIH